jgi:26S proteasome regulatory subunit N7
VNGVVETNRQEGKNGRQNALYQAVIQQGDVVLTSVQRLSRVIG